MQKEKNDEFAWSQRPIALARKSRYLDTDGRVIMMLTVASICLVAYPLILLVATDMKLELIAKLITALESGLTIAIWYAIDKHFGLFHLIKLVFVGMLVGYLVSIDMPKQAMICSGVSSVALATCLCDYVTFHAMWYTLAMERRGPDETANKEQ